MRVTSLCNKIGTVIVLGKDTLSAKREKYRDIPCRFPLRNQIPNHFWERDAAFSLVRREKSIEVRLLCYLDIWSRKSLDMDRTLNIIAFAAFLLREDPNSSVVG